jgi:N-acetyl-gamma-glutamyl-phosphate reductase
MSYLVKDELPAHVTGVEVLEVYTKYYNNEAFVTVIGNSVESLDDGFLDAQACNNTNRIELSLYENKDTW